MPDKELKAERLNIFNNGSYVRIGEDQMAAWLYLAGTEVPYTQEQIYAYLKEHGVVAGYHTSNIAAMAKKRVYFREIKVAVGKKNENSQDGYFEYTFKPENYRVPKVLKDGSVDYTSMSTLMNVHAGDVVAIYHPAVQGEDGYLVTGIKVKAEPAKNLPQIPGKGVELEEGTGIYKATIDGKVEILENRVDVRGVHEVHGDVDLITAKIDFLGDVIIWGNVEAGVVIHASRNIEIHGFVEAACLTAGGDIILSRGIQGGKKAKLKANGNIFADFIEHTDIAAGGSVRANTIMNSHVSAADKVILTGKGRRGMLIGGYTHGLCGVEATTIGNDAEVKTVVHAGYLPEDQKKYFRCKKEETEAQQKLTDTIEELTTMQRNQMMSSKTPNPLLLHRIAELKKEKDAAYENLSRIRKDKAEIAKIMEAGREAKIIADGNIYRGTIVCVGTLQMVVEHNTCYMRYYSMGGKMESNVIIK